MTTDKHEVLLRMRAIELLAYWEGRLVTNRLMSWFGLSRQQASADIKRYKGKILSAKIFKQGGKWFVSIAVELTRIEKLKPKTGLSIGVDLGVSNLATLSNGEVIPSNAPLKR